MSLVLDEHRRYLADRFRLLHYERALRELVRPGAVVVDLASGTGILGLFACRAGASRVYAIEAEPMCWTGALRAPRPVLFAVDDQTGGVLPLPTQVPGATEA